VEVHLEAMPLVFLVVPVVAMALLLLHWPLVVVEPTLLGLQVMLVLVLVLVVQALLDRVIEAEPPQLAVQEQGAVVLVLRLPGLR
jgi:hypothetical protein